MGKVWVLSLRHCLLFPAQCQTHSRDSASVCGFTSECGASGDPGSSVAVPLAGVWDKPLHLSDGL